jgi:hypothetical protein
MDVVLYIHRLTDECRVRPDEFKKSLPVPLPPNPNDTNKILYPHHSRATAGLRPPPLDTQRHHRLTPGHLGPPPLVAHRPVDADRPCASPPPGVGRLP